MKVQYFATVRELVGLREETLDLPDRSTVRVLLDELEKRHGKRLRDYLYDGKTGICARPFNSLLATFRSPRPTGVQPY